MAGHRPIPSLRTLLAAMLMLALCLPLGTSAVFAAGRAPGATAGATNDTPSPPTPRPTREPGTTPEPGETPEPTRTAPPTPGPGGVITPQPETDRLRIGYSERRIRGALPLIVAQARGYFTQAGFGNVELVLLPEPLPALLGGDLDIAVVNTVDAADGVAQGLPLQLIAGYHNYRQGGAAYGYDALAAPSDLVALEPGTIAAFLSAYLRALQDISDPAAQDAVLAVAEAAGVPVDADARRDYADRIAEFAPFDGGFGDPAQGGGLAELTAYLDRRVDDMPHPSLLIAWPALLVAQTVQQLPPNPVSDLLDPPFTDTLSVGVPGPALADRLPLVVAQANGYFDQAGFALVELIETEQALPGIVGGQIDLGVIDAAVAADGQSQGLPLRAVTGYRLDAADGAVSALDVLAANTDLLDADPGAVTAFAIATIRALQDLAAVAAAGAADPAAYDAFLDDLEAAGVPLSEEDRAAFPDAVARYAPFDGGFGDLAQDGGLGELTTYLTDQLGAAPVLPDFIAWPNLVVAQTTLGLPANPAAAAIGEVPIGVSSDVPLEPDEPSEPEPEPSPASTATAP